MATLTGQFKRDLRQFETVPVEIPAIPITTTTTQKPTTSKFINC